MKFDSNKLDEAIRRLQNALPDDFGTLKQAGEEKLKLALENMLQNMDLVTREEFDVQTAVLQRTRERVEQLEQRLAILENQQ